MKRSSPKKVKVGVVGCGVVAAAYYLPYLMTMDGVEITAVCDRFETRTQACARLFGAKEQYLDYAEMIAQAELDVVFILTAPGTHASFALQAIAAGRHVLIQKPMATRFEDALAIAAAARQAGVQVLVEPSANTPLDPDMAHLRQLIQQGVLGDVLWFSLATTGPSSYGPGLDSNPYGQDAFYTRDSGGFLFDFPYAPSQIVSLLGACKSVSAVARISSVEHRIVPEAEYDRFLAAATGPSRANYWDVVLDLPRTQVVKMEAFDNVYSVYEMASGAVGGCHVGRIFHPVLPASGDGSLQIFGSEGNLIIGAGYAASIISKRAHLLPRVEADGWYHLYPCGDFSRAKWPQPVPGGFNYYEESTRHLIECIRAGRGVLVGLDWGLHITEMMTGAVEAYTTGQRYEMTTRLMV